MRKKNLKKIAEEISTSRKKKGTQAKGKGKCKFILPEESEDEEELLATATEILEDAAINKVSVETQFKQFIESRAKQGRLKKVRTATHPEINPIDLTPDSPRPSSTRITPDSTMAISPIYNEIIPGTLKEKIDKDVELQQFINNFPNLFLKSQ